MRRLAAALALAGALAWAAGAAAQVARPVEGGPNIGTDPVSVETGNDQVRIVISADREAVAIVDRFTVTLAAEAPPWILVAFPRLVDELGPFKLIREEKAGPFVVAGADRQLQRNERRYLLDPIEPGEHSIPPMTLSVVDASKAPSIACIYLHECQRESTTGRIWPRPEFLRTGRLPVLVTSVLPADADITKPKDILPPVALPPPPPTEIPWRVIGAALAAAAALCAFVVWLRRLVKAGPRPRPVPTRPAHELALAALRRLEREEADAPERVDAYYVRLSGILRRYLDWRFDLRAPEQTTEEFLAAAVRAGDPVTGYRDTLGTFLRHCDLVKFARRRPGRPDRHDALGRAITFVEDTADASVRVPVPQGGGAR